ncbi:MAG TPA: hypothetical protein VIM08_06435 [Arthrobacter sp.]|jgi:hypothetical protein
MGFDPHEPEQRSQLRAALKAADISTGELWLNYFSIGGAVGEYEVEAYLQGLRSLPPIQRDLLAMAANELIDRVPRIHAPYSDDLTVATGPHSDTDDVESIDGQSIDGESTDQDSLGEESLHEDSFRGDSSDGRRTQSATDNQPGEDEQG